MSKQTKSQAYELALVLSPKVTETQHEATRKKILEIISPRKGAVGKTESWPKRTLSYSINGETEASYLILQVEAEALTPGDTFKIKQVEGVIRYLLLKK